MYFIAYYSLVRIICEIILNLKCLTFLVHSGKEDTERLVWVVGSSIVKNAFVHARQSYDGVHLGLKRRNVKVWWQGKGGMKWAEVLPRIKYLLTFESPPKVLIIHCGGNSIGQVLSHKLRLQIKSGIIEISSLLPETKIVWSQILPRQIWRYSDNAKSMNLTAARINNFAASFCCKLGGAYIKYPEISWDERGMFNSDGVHLSPIGNDIFLHHIQSSLLEIL